MIGLGIQAMYTLEAENFVIVGLTTSGKQFRPSEWAERLFGVMPVFGSERRMAYSPYARPGTYDAYKCVYVDARIRDIEPMAYAFLVNFAKDNQLTVAP